MNFTADRTALHKAVKTAMKALGNMKAFSEINGILFEANVNSGIISITGTDTHTQIQCRVKANHLIEGGSCILSPIVAEMLRLMPEDSVQIVDSLSSRMLDIKSGATNYTVPFLESGKYPKMQIPFPDDFICIKGLNSIIRRTIFATDTSKDASLEKRSLQFIKLSFDNGQTCAQATNGNIAAVSQLPFGSDGKLELILHQKALDTLSSVISPEEEVYVGIAGRFAVFMKEDMFFSSQLYQGQYIEGSKFVDYVKPQYRATTDGKELFGLADNVSAIFGPGDDKCINICVTDNSVAMKTKTSVGGSSAQINATNTCPTSAEGFNYNAAQLLKCLRQASGPLTISMDQRGFLLIEANGSKYCMGARNPVRIQMPEKKEEKAKKTRKTKSKAAEPIAA